MRKRRVVFLLLVCTTFLLNMIATDVSAQWASIGPEGGYIKCTVSSGSTLYAVTGWYGYSLYTSTDNGNNWTILNTSLPADVRAIAIMGNSMFLGALSGVYRSDDNGATWVLKNNGFPAGATPWVNLLAVSGTTLFAAATTSKILRSTDNGETWTVAATGITCNAINALIATETAIFTGGGSNKVGVFRSTNNGDTWTKVTNGMYYFFNGAPVYTSAPNMNAFGFNGTDLYAGTLNSQGVWKTSDNGANWVLTNVSTRTSATYSSVSGNGSTIFAGTSVNGVLRSTDNGATWAAANNGIDIYGEVRSLFSAGGVAFAGTKAGIYRSADNGVNWTKSTSGISGHQIAYPAIAVLGTDMFVGTNTGGIFRSSDDGSNWMTVNNGLPLNVNNGSYSVLANSTTLFAYSVTSVNHGNSWEIPTSPGTGGYYIEHGTARFAIKSYTDPGVYRSTDDGATWTLVNNGIGVNDYVFVSVYSDGTTLYLGTDVAYYYSTDNGDNWIPGIFPDYNAWSFSGASFVSSGSARIMGLSGGGGQQGLFRTIDNGANWALVNDLLVQKLIVSGYKTLASGSSAGSPSILLSQDAGVSWSAIASNLNNIYTSTLAAEGLNVYVATSSPDNGIYRSVDNGANWVNVRAGLNLNAQVTSLDVVNAKLIAATNGFSLWQRSLADFTAPVQPGAISGSAAPCVGSSQTYSVPNVPGVAYTWQIPSNWTITAGNGTNSISVTVGSFPGIVLVTPANAFGTGPAQFVIVSPTSLAPGQPGAISGTTAPLEGTILNYSVVNDPGVAYAWTFPSGWVQTAGGTTNSVTVTTGAGSGNIEVTPSTTCGTGPIRTLAVVTSPANISVSNIIINGQNQCYNASGTIVVAGSENTFLVQNGGQATFIAGQMISFLPGTTVVEGGYLLGTITTTGQYCGALPAAKTIATATAGLEPATETIHFRLWPNPTTGSFTLEQSGDGTGQDLKLEIYSMMGERIMTDNIIGEKQHQFMLGNVPTGIYLVRIMAGEKAETIKLIKQ